jgi:DNA invertase Pin-like site-specific DNA recombinase
MKKKVIELIRVSTEGQATQDKASIPAQRAINRRTCTNYGLEIVETIKISDVSGASVLRTPEIRRMLERMESPDIKGVVTREFSRFDAARRLRRFCHSPGVRRYRNCLVFARRAD